MTDRQSASPEAMAASVPNETLSSLQQMTVERFTHIAMSMNPYEILLSFGSTNQIMDVNTNSLISDKINWERTCSLSPITAKILLLGLAEAVKVYEKEFGPIPKDPSSQVKGLNKQEQGGPRRSK